MSQNHRNHDVVSSNEEFGYNPVNEGIAWCRDCETEIVMRNLK